MKVNFEDFANLPGSDLGVNVPTPPELDFFHSIYISGKSRRINDQLIEQAGFLQIRGVSYNHDEVNFIITHIKDILVNETTINKKTQTICFSYKDGEWPWYGTTLENGKPRMCGKINSERAANPFCNSCKSQIIVAGILTDADGNPLRGDDNSPIFGFVRGKGIRYNNVSNMVSNYVQMDVDPPIFDLSNEDARKREKIIVNHKRFVTNITIGSAPTKQWGEYPVFEFKVGKPISPENTVKILTLSNNVYDKFVEKFDWSKGNKLTANQYSANVIPEENKFTADTTNVQTQQTEESKTPTVANFSFDDLNDIKF